jgi:hypothetical protein
VQHLSADAAKNEILATKKTFLFAAFRVATPLLILIFPRHDVGGFRLVGDLKTTFH